MTDRMNIPLELADQLMFDCDRTCCICKERFARLQFHHIDQKSENSIEENLIVVCVGCHSEIHTKGGFGREWTTGLLRKYKADWLATVSEKRKKYADLVSTHTVTGEPGDIPAFEDELEYRGGDVFHLKQYLIKILLVHKGQLLIAQADWDQGITSVTIEGVDKMIRFYQAVLVELATYYPKGHFQEKDPRIFFDEQVAERSSFQISIAFPEEGEWLPGMTRTAIYSRIMQDLKEMVKQMGLELIERLIDPKDEELEGWGEKWANEKGAYES